LAGKDVDIYVSVIQKDVPIVQDTPENYARLLFPVIGEILSRFPDSSFAFDKHFARPIQNERVKDFLENLAGQELDLKLADSQTFSGIQIADFVAGAVLAKYQRENARFFELVRRRVIMENWSDWGEMKKW
jgi:hypothetical protein